MIVRKFFQWAQSAPAGQRADAASALARAYLYTALAAADRRDTEVALTALLDDPSPLVRRALADAFAHATQAPHHLIAALAGDQSEVSAIILNRSPLLSDAELIDAAAVGDALAQSAIALRPQVSAPVAAALAEVGGRDALIALAVNEGAALPEFSMRRMLERFGDDGELREALRSRPGLPPALCNDIVIATASVLTDFVTRCNFMSRERAERITREARERATVTIAASSSGEATLELVAHLRQSGTLTAGLILRALLCGHTNLFEAALSELSGIDLNRVVGLVRERGGSGFAALYKKARLPNSLMPAFRAALASAEEFGAALDPAEGAQLSLRMIERVLSACAAINGGELDRLLALLRRFEAEAAREEARKWAGDQAPPAALPQRLEACLAPEIRVAAADIPPPSFSVAADWTEAGVRNGDEDLSGTEMVQSAEPYSTRAAEIDAIASQAILGALEAGDWEDISSVDDIGSGNCAVADGGALSAADPGEWDDISSVGDIGSGDWAVADDGALSAADPGEWDGEPPSNSEASVCEALTWGASVEAEPTAPPAPQSALVQPVVSPVADAILDLIRADLSLRGGNQPDADEDYSLTLFRRELLADAVPSAMAA
jgi:uncharacterized protein (DUF2336 family)